MDESYLATFIDKNIRRSKEKIPSSCNFIIIQYFNINVFCRTYVIYMNE